MIQFDESQSESVATQEVEKDRPILGEVVNESDEALIVKEILGIKKRSEEFYAGRRSRWLDYFNHYINRPRVKTRTTIPAPIASEHVDIVLADMVTRQFASRPFCGVRGRSDDDQQSAPLIEALIQYQFDRMDIFDIYTSAAKQALMLSSTPFRVCYEQKFVEVPLPGQQGTEGRFNENSGALIIPYDIFDYFPDSSKVSPNDPAPSIVRSYRPYEYLVEQQDLYPDVYRNVSKIPHKRVVSMDKDDLQARQERQTAMGMSPENSERGLVEILECDMMWPVRMRDGSYIERPCIFTLANGILIRAHRNPYISQNANMGIAVIDKLPNDLFGVGLIEKMHPQVHGANTVLDMILTNLELTVDKMLVVNTEQVKREEELHNRSGGVIHSRGDVNSALRWFDGGSIVPEAFLLYQNFRGASEGASGVKPVKQGAISSDTATAVNAAQSESGSRFNLYMMMMEHSFVIPAAKMMHQINQQFLDLPTVVPVLGQQGIAWPVVDYETIAIDADFIPEGSTREMNKQMNIAQIENFLSIVSRVPGLQPLIPLMVGKLAREFRWPDAQQIEQLCSAAVQQQMMLEMLMQQQQQQLEQQKIANSGAGKSAPKGKKKPKGGGRINQIASEGNMSGMNATNPTDLGQAFNSKFGASAFS